MIYAAIFLLSLACLAWEALLPRIFAFTQWHHLAFLVISVAVFGFGAGGAAASLAERRRAGAGARFTDPARPQALGWLSLLFCLAGAGSLAFLRGAPLDYFRLPVEARQAGLLALSWLLLLLPFLLAGLVQALAFAALPGRSGWLYAAGMGGGACGALLPLLLLKPLGEARLALSCLMLPALPWLLAPLRRGARRLPAWLLGLGALAATALGAAAAGLPAFPVLELEPSPYKLLAQARQLQGTRLLATGNGPAGRVDWLDSPALRFAPGLSLAFPGGLPQPEQAVLDGDELLQLFPLAEPARLGFSGYCTAFAAYALRGGRPGVLVLLESGGLALPCAVWAGASRIQVVVRHPAVARRLREMAPGLRVLTGSPRAILARSREFFDLVQLESWGASAPGAASLQQDHLLTVEGVESCLRRLGPDGLFSVSRRIQLPPSDSLRLFGTTFQALRRLGLRDPSRHIAMLRSWDTYTLLAGRRPLGLEDRERLERFCRERSFDLLFLEGLGEQEANRFVVYERPYHYLELRRLAAALQQGREAEYYRGYLLDVRPATDEKPFPGRFLKPLRAGELYRATGRRPFSLLLSGEAVLLATVVLALAVGLPLLLLPWARRELVPRSPALGYFLACGAGYLWVEMAVIQDLTFLFAQPATAVAAALAVLLVCSGAGAAFCVGARSPTGPLAGLVGALTVQLAVRRSLLASVLALPPAWALLRALLPLALLGFLMGIPLPVALRLLPGGGARRAYAWAANGVAGVLASVLALPLAMVAGIWSVHLAGAAAYLAALLILLGSRAARPPAGRRPAA